MWVKINRHLQCKDCFKSDLASICIIQTFYKSFKLKHMSSTLWMSKGLISASQQCLTLYDFKFVKVAHKLDYCIHQSSLVFHRAACVAAAAGSVFIEINQFSISHNRKFRAHSECIERAQCACIAVCNSILRINIILINISTSTLHTYLTIHH